jgi:hypothetical protein
MKRQTRCTRASQTRRGKDAEVFIYTVGESGKVKTENRYVSAEVAHEEKPNSLHTHYTL